MDEYIDVENNTIRVPLGKTPDRLDGKLKYLISVVADSNHWSIVSMNRVLIDYPEDGMYQIPMFEVVLEDLSRIPNPRIVYHIIRSLQAIAAAPDYAG